MFISFIPVFILHFPRIRRSPHFMICFYLPSVSPSNKPSVQFPLNLGYYESCFIPPILPHLLTLISPDLQTSEFSETCLEVPVQLPPFESNFAETLLPAPFQSRTLYLTTPWRVFVPPPHFLYLMCPFAPLLLPSRFPPTLQI